jgi:hypothetical protein
MVDLRLWGPSRCRAPSFLLGGLLGNDAELTLTSPDRAG